ncbi:DNA gyrase subunit A [Fusobacterium ulcerans]|uniref:DNA gyrase subunit A n=1 Tax=Fusobacterium ulcerans TaxID=861 RepID=UPI001D0A8918|nr:DNA gyrase subunit A [Fusobacterium ulcerans]MCB8565858.1 DNA gyrase subunit A [Fusobacterium ulcerans]MCB8649884.1 DNA gyrase subunit A [Fusobacterium ulcerans]
MSNVNNRYIEDEMKESYLDYSMSVIVSRALPDVRDGMKPVHRRILFAMSELGMTYDKAYKKSARIVGEVLGKYHPHGDSAVYGTMVRMAQDFNYRYLLVDGHGNFGSIDGDSAAAMRYTEARMAKISNELIDDIDKNTIDFRKNFDDSLDEPTVLPAKLPNLLLNGATGIAVGMATNIPPHNLGELIDGILALIDNPELTPLDLMEYIKGPDFPTGGIIDGQKGIRDAYMTGRGKVRVRGKVEIEEQKNGKASIIIKEIPYQLNKSTLIERIADLVKDKRVTGITDLRDESDRHGIRVVIEVKKGEEPELILNKLYKYTELQNTFGIIMLALVNNAPRVLNLKEILHEYIKHRFEVVTRRTKFDLDKAEKRAHILQGYRIALDNIDRIIEIIRGSSDGNQARELLIEKYAFSDVQARAILDMKLQRLTGLERGKIDAEYEEIEKYIAELREILSHDSKIYEIIKEELLYLKEKYNDNRRTLIENERMEILPEDLIKDENVILTLTNKGYVKRMEVSKYKAQKRGGKGVASQNTIEDDFVESIESASNLDTLMIFTNQGRVFNIKVYEIPETSKQSRGKLMSNIIRTREDEKIRAVIKTRDFSKENEVVFVTKEGLIKKTNLDEFKNINNSGLKAIKLKEEDDIIYVGLIEKIDQEQVFIATKQGYSIRFNSDNVRPTGRDTMGVKSITLRPGDSIVSALLIKDEEGSILTVTENGYGKRTRIDEYPLQARSGKGVINIRCNAKTGAVVSVLPVTEGEELMAITSSGIVIRMPLDTIALYGRATQGVIIMKVDGAEKVVSITRVKSEEEEEISDFNSIEDETNIEEVEIVETKED